MRREGLVWLSLVDDPCPPPSSLSSPRQPDPDPPDTQSEESDGESFRKVRVPPGCPWRPCPVRLCLTLAPTSPSLPCAQLYAELRLENQRLREALTETTLQLAQLKVELERATQVRGTGRGPAAGHVP